MDHHMYSHEEVKLKITLRKLVTDHATWTRMYIVDLLFNSPSLDKTKERLLKNQESIGNCLKPFFGESAGDTLTSLLKEHVTILIDLLESIKIKDDTRTTILEANAMDNSENISTFFSAINPCYSKQEMIDMLNTHLILVKYQFISRMNADYNSDIIYYDMELHHILMLSDFLFNGIKERFYEMQMNEQNQSYIYQTEDYLSDLPDQYQQE